KSPGMDCKKIVDCSVVPRSKSSARTRTVLHDRQTPDGSMSGQTQNMRRLLSLTVSPYVSCPTHGKTGASQRSRAQSSEHTGDLSKQPRYSTRLVPSSAWRKPINVNIQSIGWKPPSSRTVWRKKGSSGETKKSPRTLVPLSLVRRIDWRL